MNPFSAEKLKRMALRKDRTGTFGRGLVFFGLMLTIFSTGLHLGETQIIITIIDVVFALIFGALAFKVYKEISINNETTLEENLQ